MKVQPNFEEEIQAIDPRFTIVNNPNFAKLKNIYFEGKNWDLPPLPADEIKDTSDPTYFMVFPNGMSAPFHSRDHVILKLKEFLADLPNRRKLYE